MTKKLTSALVFVKFNLGLLSDDELSEMQKLINKESERRDRVSARIRQMHQDAKDRAEREALEARQEERAKRHDANPDGSHSSTCRFCAAVEPEGA